MRRWGGLVGGVLLLGVAGCGKPSPYAAGSGYGVGIPRTHFMFHLEPQARGQSTMGLPRLAPNDTSTMGPQIEHEAEPSDRPPHEKDEPGRDDNARR